MRLFKHYPSGFGVLYGTQAFFNISFYGLKSIFVLYIILKFSLSEKEAVSLFAAFMALAYACSILGGWIADKGLGIKNSVVLGGIFQSVGVLCLLFPSQEGCFAALALISLGAGFFKPTLSASVGMLFEDPLDSRKDKAYSTLYIAMNLGGFLGPLICGFISTREGYTYSLILLAASIMIATWVFYKKAHFRNETLSPGKDSLTFLSTLGGVGASLFILYFIFKYHSSFDHLMALVALGSFLALGRVFWQCTPQERRDVLTLLLYILLFTFFCALFEQAGGSLMLFFNKAVDRQVMGLEFPPSAFLSLGAIYVLIFTHLLSLFQDKALEKKKPMDGLIKIGVGFVCVSLSFVILALSCWKESGLVSSFWVSISLLVQTLGELLIVPIGFSNVSKLSPVRFRSVMMSFWMMAIAYGHYFAGFIARFSLSDQTLLGESSLEHYRHFFLNLGLLSLVVPIVLGLFYGVKISKRTPRI